MAYRPLIVSSHVGAKFLVVPGKNGFVFENENKEHHGIIDLMIIEDNLITIVDYKLNHLFDEAYIKQLNGYQKYIKEQSGKPVELYLYSILKEDFLAIKNNQVMLWLF